MRRLYVALLCLLALPQSLRAQASGAEFERAIAASLDSVYMMGVARRGNGGPEVFQFVGTGWVIADGKLATNAHVAEALLESSLQGRLVAKRSWSDRDELALSASSMRIHPAYGPWNARLKRVVVRNENDPNVARSMNFIPIADVAIVEVEAGNTAKPLGLSDPAKVEPMLSEPVVYVGFPHENISGFPTLHAVPGYVTAKTDFFFQRSAWPDSYLLHYCGPVVGGASGSPILNRAGQVIGLISAAENNLSMNGERTSFGFAYGQRVDLARELLSDDYAQVQARRDSVWSQRLANLLIPPDELLEQIAATQAAKDGVTQLSSANTVTRRQVVVTQSDPARLQVTLEPGLRYGFLAAAHDGSDVDAQVLVRETSEAIGVDVQTDYFPCVWVGPFDQRVAVTFEIVASERLLADTTCSLQVYKYEPRLINVDAGSEESDGFFHTDHVVAEGEPNTVRWRFHVEPGAQVMFAAESADSYDIDLLLALDGEIVTSDESADAVPIVMHTTEKAGELELRLRIPVGTPAGAVISVKGLQLGGPKPIALDGAPSPDDAEEYSREQMLAFLDQVLAEVWRNAGVEGQSMERDVTTFDGELRLQFSVPAGSIAVFVAVAPHGEDIDMDAYLDGELIGSDNASDSTPLVALSATDQDRRVELRIHEGNPTAGVRQMSYGFSLVPSK